VLFLRNLLRGIAKKKLHRFHYWMSAIMVLKNEDDVCAVRK